LSFAQQTMSGRRAQKLHLVSLLPMMMHVLKRSSRSSKSPREQQSACPCTRSAPVGRRYQQVAGSTSTRLTLCTSARIYRRLASSANVVLAAARAQSSNRASDIVRSELWVVTDQYGMWRLTFSSPRAVTSDADECSKRLGV
jgi:hypothetical protein